MVEIRVFRIKCGDTGNRSCVIPIALNSAPIPDNTQRARCIFKAACQLGVDGIQDKQGQIIDLWDTCCESAGLVTSVLLERY